METPHKPNALRDSGVRSEKTIQEELQTLPEAQRAQAARIAESFLVTYRRQYFQALRGELSPRKAIRIMCFHCVGWERAAAYECTARGCPLWASRPKHGKSPR